MPVSEQGSTSTFTAESLTCAGSNSSVWRGLLPSKTQHFFLKIPFICGQLCSLSHLSVWMWCHDLGSQVKVTENQCQALLIPVRVICFHCWETDESWVVNTAMGIAKLGMHYRTTVDWALWLCEAKQWGRSSFCAKQGAWLWEAGEMLGCRWKEENSQRLQRTGDPPSLFLSSCWQRMNHQIYEKVGKDLIWVMWQFPGNLPWLCEGLFTVFCHV